MKTIALNFRVLPSTAIISYLICYTFLFYLLLLPIKIMRKFKKLFYSIFHTVLRISLGFSVEFVRTFRFRLHYCSLSNHIWLKSDNRLAICFQKFFPLIITRSIFSVYFSYFGQAISRLVLSCLKLILHSFRSSFYFALIISTASLSNALDHDPN